MANILKGIVQIETKAAVASLEELREEQELLKKEISDFNESLKKNEKEIKRVESALKEILPTSNAAIREIGRLKDETKNLYDQQGRLTAGLNNAKSALANNATAIKANVKETTAANTANINFDRSLKGLTSGSQIATNVVRGLGQAISGMLKTMVMGAVIGVAVAALGALVNAFDNSAKAAEKAEDAIDRMKAANDKLRNTANKAGEETLADQIQKLKNRIIGGDQKFTDLTIDLITVNKGIVLMSSNTATAKKELKDLSTELAKVKGITSLTEAQERSDLRNKIKGLPEGEAIPGKFVSELGAQTRAIAENYNAQLENIKIFTEKSTALKGLAKLKDLQIDVNSADDIRNVQEKASAKLLAANERSAAAETKRLEKLAAQRLKDAENVAEALAKIAGKAVPSSGDSKSLFGESNAKPVFQTAIENQLAKIQSSPLNTLIIKMMFDKESADRAAADVEASLAPINASIESTLENLASGLGEALGSIFTGGNPFQALFSVMGDGLKTFGRSLIAYGVALEAFKKAFANPVVAIAAGIAAIALGSIVSAKAQSLSGARALGGPVNSGGSYLVGEKGAEVFVPRVNGDIIPNQRAGNYGGMTSGGSGGNVIFKIHGKELVGILASANISQRRLS